MVAGSDTHGPPVVLPDPDGTRPGRGAHLHPTGACFDLALRRKAFGRALRLASAPDTSLLADHLAESGTTDRDRPTRNWSPSS